MAAVRITGISLNSVTKCFNNAAPVGVQSLTSDISAVNWGVPVKYMLPQVPVPAGSRGRSGHFPLRHGSGMRSPSVGRSCALKADSSDIHDRVGGAHLVKVDLLDGLSVDVDSASAIGR